MQLQRQCIDDHTREYYSRQKLTNKRMEAAATGEPQEAASEQMVGIGVALGFAGTIIDPSAPVENGLLAAVVAIPGVEVAILVPYMMRVQKAKMYDWDEIEPTINKLLASFNLNLTSTRIMESVEGRKRD